MSPVAMMMSEILEVHLLCIHILLHCVPLFYSLRITAWNIDCIYHISHFSTWNDWRRRHLLSMLQGWQSEQVWMQG